MQGESAFSVVRVVDSNFDGKASAVTSQARAGRESQALVGQCPLHAFGIMGDHGQVGAGRLVGLATPLLPVAEGSQRNVVAQSKFLLGQGESAAQRSGARHAARGGHLPGRHRPGVGVRKGSCGYPGLGHRSDWRVWKRDLGTVGPDLHDCAVIANFRGNSCLTHAFPPVWPIRSE